jgi:hypothetical protein
MKFNGKQRKKATVIGLTGNDRDSRERARRRRIFDYAPTVLQYLPVIDLRLREARINSAGPFPHCRV